MSKSRKEIVDEARRIRKEISQIFIDVAHWNNNVRTAFEQPVDPDPDGQLARIAASIDRTLAIEDERERRSNLRLA